MVGKLIDGIVPREGFQRRVERISQAVVRLRVRDDEADFGAVRGLLLDWLHEKAGRPLSDAMLRGETDHLDLLGAQRVETVALEDPRVWAARQDYQDENVARRSWVTEAMLARPSIGANILVLGFRLHCVTLGNSAPFSRSVPRFMREVARRYPVYLDGVEIDLEATPVETDDDTDALVALLGDPQRRAPVVGISLAERPLADRPLIDPDRLANAVFGTAHVRVLSRSAGFGLTDRIGKRFSVFNGAVRIWWPGLRTDHDDPYDHPLWLAQRIEDDGPYVAQRDIVDLLLRASAGRRDADDAIPSFAEARRIASTLAREKAAESGQSSEELLALYEAENARLLQDLEDVKAEQAELLAVADADLKTATAERDEARAEIHVLRARLTEMMNALQTRDQQSVIPIPDNFDELEDWADQHLGNGVELLPRAINAAKKSVFDDPPLAYQALLLMRNVYVPMRRDSSLGMKERWDSGLRQLGLDCTPTHAGPRAGEFASDYFVMYDGHRTEIDMHLKGSNSRDPRYCFRVYFFWCDEKMRLVVASLPSHLDSRLT